MYVKPMFPLPFRRSNKYRVFGGLWFGEEKPFFSTFFKPFIEALRKTENFGKNLQNSKWLFFVVPCCTW